MKISKLLYIPDLHPALLPRPLPDGLRFIKPGLDVADKTGIYLTPENLPFSPQEASAILRETLELGETMSRGGGLLLSNFGQRSDVENTRLRREKRDLDRFAAGLVDAAHSENGPVASAHEAESPSELLKSCQKVLLLAWQLGLDEMHILREERELERKNSLLRAALSDGEPLLEDDASVDAFEKRPDLPGVSWKTILEAAAALTSPDTAFFSFDQAVFEELADRGLSAPLSDELAGELSKLLPGLPAKELSGLMIVERPLWEILGYSAPKAELAAMRPWLPRPRLLVLAGRQGCADGAPL